MSIKDNLKKMRDGGHHVPIGLDEIIHDLDRRISALESKPADKPNPLDGTNLKS